MISLVEMTRLRIYSGDVYVVNVHVSIGRSDRCGHQTFISMRHLARLIFLVSMDYPGPGPCDLASPISALSLVKKNSNVTL